MGFMTSKHIGKPFNGSHVFWNVSVIRVSIYEVNDLFINARTGRVLYSKERV